MRITILNQIYLLTIVIVGLGLIATPVLSQEASEVMELRRLVEAQQKQLEVQQRQLASQQKQLEMQEKQFELQKQSLQDLQARFKTLDDEKPTVAYTPGDKVITSDGPGNIKLSISGHVNRAMNVVSDGKETKAYFVDNDNSESRINIVGTGKINEDLTLGSRLEVSISPNNAGIVSQVDEEAGDFFEQRWAEVSLDSKRFGKLSLGRGYSATYGTGSSDLSGTNVITTSTIADLAGGMFFRQSSDDSLTDITIRDAFNDFNGLSRKNRIRYDSPKFYGFHLAMSAISDDRYDAGLYWGGQGYGLKAVAAAGIADLSEDDTDFQYSGSFSFLHEDTGLNLSLSAGGKKRDVQDDATNYFVKAGWLADLFSFGKSAFSVDYTLGENLPTDDDDGYSFGIAAVQQFNDYGAELYAMYRLYSLDRDVDADVHDIGVSSIGLRVKF
jgi:predicted porin